MQGFSTFLSAEPFYINYLLKVPPDILVNVSIIEWHICMFNLKTFILLVLQFYYYTQNIIKNHIITLIHNVLHFFHNIFFNTGFSKRELFLYI